MELENINSSLTVWLQVVTEEEDDDEKVGYIITIL